MKKIKKIWLWLILLWGVYCIFPFFISVDIPKIPQSTIIYDNNKNEIWETIYNQSIRHRFISYEETPIFFRQALVAIEDRRFFWHSGIDYISIGRAFINNFQHTPVQWASTIENQLIRNSYWLNENRNYTLKIKEFILSLALNTKMSKQKILETYINNVNFWYLNYGAESAAHFYYNKSLSTLSKAEMIGLITIIKNPNLYNPITNLKNFNRRYTTLINTLFNRNIISKQEAILIQDEQLIFSTGSSQTLPYINDFIQKSMSGTSQKNHIYTTIDTALTHTIENLSESTLKKLAWKNVGDYSVIIVEKDTMKLKVMIGWKNYNLTEWQVNGALALRQPGSSLKPFLYVNYFKTFWKTPSSMILDLPISYQTALWTSYEPKNYSLSYAWEISLAEALAQSINIPAVKILNELGITQMLHFFQKVGITTLNQDADYYGLSLALWSGEVSLYELTQAYSIFTQKWNFCKIVYLENTSKKCHFIIEEKYINMVIDILTNRYFKLAGFPIHSNLDFDDRYVFVKTWTSRNFKDNWSIWFTDKYLIWVWVWNKSWSEMQWVSGASGAGDIFRKIVYELETTPITPKIYNLENTSSPFIKITSPLNNNTYKLNWSIPLDQQKIKLTFISNMDYDNITWYLDNKILTNNFINILDIQKKSAIKIEIKKNGKIIWTDEIYIHLQ